LLSAEGYEALRATADMPAAMGLLFLFRHGETDLTQGHYCGSSDPPLSERGRDQAARIAELLRRRPIAAIYSSPQARAMQTAEPSARALDLEVCRADGLREIDFGAWEGLSFEAAREHYPEVWRARQADPYLAAAPGGESYRDLAVRVIPAFDELLARHCDDFIAVFGHKSVNRVFLAYLLGMPVAYYRRIGQEPGAVSVVKSRASGVEVLTINERCHLGFCGGDLCRALSGAQVVEGPECKP
jgi:probable phosphoglycerate mutase